MRRRMMISIAACLALVTSGFVSTAAQAQVRRPRPAPPAVVPAPSPPAAVPVPASDVPAQPAPQELSGQTQISAEGQIAAERGSGRILRSSQLIGLHIWNAQNQRLGTIREFVIDYQTTCPTIFLVMAPEAGLPIQHLVVFPFDVLEFGTDNVRRTSFFRIDLQVDQLVRAPHIVNNNFEVLRDRQFVANTRQFFQRFERTASRPGGAQPREAPKPDMRRERQPAQPAPGTQPAPGREQPDVRPDREPAPPSAPGIERQPQPRTEKQPKRESPPPAPKTEGQPQPPSEKQPKRESPPPAPKESETERDQPKPPSTPPSNPR